MPGGKSLLRLFSVLVSIRAVFGFQSTSPKTMLLSTARTALKSYRPLISAGSVRVRTFRMTSAEPAPAAVADKFDHLKVEKKWQDYWEANKTFKAVRREGKGKKYILDMFPYPSGAGLHVGHPEGYTATDIMARYYRMKDLDVLHPMGWDSFGLPAEQHAINTGTHPRETTAENIANFKRQLKSLGFAFDWDREVATTDLDYVKWTQWIFLQLFKKGLATQSEVLVNWCPALGTVLANEEVIDGLSERGSHPVKRLPLRQWVFKITEYADQLEAGLEEAGLQWPEGTRAAQKAWIGRSVGARIDFRVAGAEDAFSVFTTRPDTLLGVTYVVLAPEHPLVEKITAEGQKEAVRAYVEAAAGKSDMDRTAVGAKAEKTGVATGAAAVHPLTGEEVPIWVADYVLGSYGTGAVMAVPAHDERDFAFARAFGLPVQQVVAPTEGEEGAAVDEEAAFTAPGVAVNSGEFDGLATEACKAAVIARLEALGAGGAQVTYKLRDWVFSRQRYWGEPIPVYFPVALEDPGGDPRAGAAHTIDFDTPIPVPEDQLPLTLPEMDDFQPGDDPAGCLARAKDWRYFQDPEGSWFARETNTMPQWAGSCWYYFRYTDNLNAERAWSEEADRDWMPVDLYVGGQEHAVLHLLYARFWHKVLYDLGHTRHPEPFQKLVHQGMILGSDNEKMSKSRGNVVNPDDVVQESGADALRLYEMFMGPLEATKPWQTSQVAGVVRFRDRVYNLARRELADEMDEETTVLMHKTIKKVTEDVEALSFNTAIAQMMVLSNHLAAQAAPAREAVEALTLLVSPFAPHVAEECWELLGRSEGTVANVPWPEYDEALMVETKVTMAIQVNGKVRGTMDIAVDADEATATKLALAQENVQNFTEGKEIKKIIYKAGKIMNIVAK
mmetsp:Transcript_18039/g.29667  ORF Transcript_18039/g.29667 Transcript_18039/m.29667 type:complete len:897 (+) Transcript_18039:150-2840(+)